MKHTITITTDSTKTGDNYKKWFENIDNHKEWYQDDYGNYPDYDYYTETFSTSYKVTICNID